MFGKIHRSTVLTILSALTIAALSAGCAKQAETAPPPPAAKPVAAVPKAPDKPKEEPLNQWVPLVEFAFDSPNGRKTTATANPGLSYVAVTWQIAVEGPVRV